MEEDLGLFFVAYGRERILSSWLKSMVLKVCSGDSRGSPRNFQGQNDFNNNTQILFAFSLSLVENGCFQKLHDMILQQIECKSRYENSAVFY